MNLLGSIRKTAAAEVKRLRAQNPTLLAARGPIWLRLLAPITTNRSLLRVLAAYGGIWTIWVLVGMFLRFPVPAVLAPLIADFQSGTLRDLLGAMLGAQVTMVGLIFPLALGMVTLIVQRDEGAASNADVQLYYDQSLAYAVGTSGIGLAIALVAGLFSPEALVLGLAGRSDMAWSISLAITGVLATWLFANLLVTWQFLIVSMSFIAPSYRAKLRQRFVAARIIPRHLAALLAGHRYLKIDEHLNAGATFMPYVMAGATEGVRGDRAISVALSRPARLADVRLVPLRLAVRLWAWRCRRAKTGAGADKYDWMLGLVGPLDRDFRGEVLLCRRKGGVPLNGLERWLIRRSLVIGRPVEPETLGPSEILEELADRVALQIDRTAVTSFDNALKEMRAFHHFLLNAYTIVDAQGAVSSYAGYGDWSSEHSNWVREYRRLFDRAANAILREDSFIGSLAFTESNLIPDRKDRVPPWIVGGLYELSQYMVHRLGHWLTAQRAPRGVGIGALVPGALPQQVAKAYRSVIVRIVGAHESALHAGARYARAAEGAEERAAWATLSASWPILFKHLESSAYLIVASHWHEDEIGAELYTESFLKWRDTLGDLAESDGQFVLRTGFLNSDLVDHDWGIVDARVTPLLLHPSFREAGPAVVFGAVLANLHADMRVVTTCVLAGWAAAGTSIHGSAAAARHLANASDGHGSHASLDLVRTFVRLRLAEWAADASGYIGLLDTLVSRLDGMVEGERVAGRVYSVDTRFRVSALAGDWFALVAALGDDAAFAAIATWLGALGEDQSAAELGDENLWQLQTWLNRKAELWSHPASQFATADAIGALDPVLTRDEAGEGLHAALVSASATIAAHRDRRLAAAPIDPDALARLQAAVVAQVGDLAGRIALFPKACLQIDAGRSSPVRFRMNRVDKRSLVAPPLHHPNPTFSEHFAGRLADHAAAIAWRPYFKLPRRHVVVATAQDLFDAASVEAAKIAATGARPLLLLPSQATSWPDVYEAHQLLGDAASKRDDEALPRSYLLTYAGIDVHRSGFDAPELFGDDLLESVHLRARDPAVPVTLEVVPDTDPTELVIAARFAVTGQWRQREVITFSLRKPRVRKKRGSA
ncbi:MAG: hypothetical protein KF730_17295 [Sphingomonas sp.]|uniref:hypothetical protein n=1 Tax=Sphingomonas sp. TaxID=28214 RepID=UPI0025E7BAAA|nr:hypothetical protein [Sphingomonas sp.]MBX3566318.1 hypothetical protein [Sphingomonas sp.]